MANILRGEIYWADLFNRRSGTVIAMAITSQPQRAGLPLTFRIKISQIRTISIERLGKRLAAVENEQLDQIVDGLIALIT